MQKTLVLIKPDAVERGLVGEITGRMEGKGLTLVGMKMIQLDDAMLKEHYAHLADKPFFPGIAGFMKSTPVVVQCWEGVEAVEVVRLMVGVTNARAAAPGTIRGDLAMSIQSNLVHASDSLETAQVEVPRFFKAGEVLSYKRSAFEYMYAPDEKSM
ncbi:nucleoside-diphosphate kinase [Candidatus Peregrinibacteria bacterium]|nr:MAG: nucleoside-diphosphate kinase [Candidatus Peregrinibacteria bacterium]